MAESTGAGYGMIGGRFAIGSSRTSTRAQTLQSQRLAPPAKPVPHPARQGLAGFLLLAGVVGLMVAGGQGKPHAAVGADSDPSRTYGIALALAMLGVLIGLSNRVTPKRLEQWKRAHHLWEQSFYCGRCDGVFHPHHRDRLLDLTQDLLPWEGIY